MSNRYRDDELTTPEKLRRLPWSIAASSANTFFNTFTVSGSVFVLFISALGLSKTQIGLLFSLFPFAQIISLFILPAVARFGYKRTYLLFYGIRKGVAGCLIVAPWVLARWGGAAVFLYVSTIIALYGLCRAIAETGMHPWRQEYIPREVQGKFFAVNSLCASLAGLVAVSVASFVLGEGAEQANHLQRFQLLILIGVGFGLLMVWLSTHLPGGAPVHHAVGTKRSEFGEALRDGRFLPYLLVVTLMAIATGPLNSFMPLLMKEQIGLNAGQVVRTQMGSMVGMLLSSYGWGWAADRYGSKGVTLVGLGLMILMPLTWMVLPRQTAVSALVATVIAFVQGAAGMGWSVGSTRLLYADVVPVEKKGGYMAVYYAWTGLVSGLSELLGGRLLDLTGSLRGAVWVFTLDPFSPLIILSACLALFSLLLTRRIQAS